MLTEPAHWHGTDSKLLGRPTSASGQERTFVGRVGLDSKSGCYKKPGDVFPRGSEPGSLSMQQRPVKGLLAPARRDVPLLALFDQPERRSQKGGDFLG